MMSGFDTSIEKAKEPSNVDEDGKPSFLSWIRGLFLKEPYGELITPDAKPLELNRNVRIIWGDQPFALTIGNIVLEFHSDLPVTGELSDGSKEWIIHTGRTFYENVPMFIRIGPGESVLLGRADNAQINIFRYDNSVADRHVRIFNRKGELTIQPLDFERPTRISKVDSPRAVWATRAENLKRLPGILGYPLRQFDDGEALDLIRRVNSILATETRREPDDEGAPGWNHPVFRGHDGCAHG